MACTMGRPSPNPPASRLRYGSARAKRAKMWSRSPGGMPQPESVHRDDRVPVLVAHADLDAVPRPGVCDGVLQQRVQRHREPVGVAGHGGLGRLAQPPVARHVPPPLQRIQHQGIGGHRGHLEEVRRPGRGQQQQPAGQPAQPGQFPGDHPGVRGEALVGGGLLDQLGVAERDGDRGAELVGGVHQELALLLQQAHVLLGDPLHLLHRGQPSWVAASLRRPCSTMTRNISAISGTSAR